MSNAQTATQSREEDVRRHQDQEKKKAKARLLQRKVLTWLSQVRPMTEREFYRVYHLISLNIRDELSGREPRVVIDYLGRLVKQVQVSCTEMAVKDHESLLPLLRDIDNFVWKLRLAKASSNVESLLELFGQLKRRSGVIYAKLHTIDPNQLALFSVSDLESVTQDIPPAK